MTAQTELSAGQIWLVRFPNGAALVKVEVLDVFKKAVELEPTGRSTFTASRGIYELDKDVKLVERIA